MIKLKKVLSLAIISLVFLPLTASATGVLSGLNAAAAGTGLEKNSDMLKFIGSIISIILGLLGVILVGILIYAGIVWGFLAQGDLGKIKKAKDMIINAIIGLAIVFASYAITNFVFESFNASMTAR
jgi:hypothetical protein